MKRNPWPYAILLYFVIFIAAMAAWIVFAVRHDHELVRKDYYEYELKFQSDIDNQRRSASFNVLAYDATKQVVTITLPPGSSNGSVYFYRPSNAKLDRTLPLQNTTQPIDVGAFAAGLWKLRVTWTADSADYQYNATVVL